MSGSDTLKFIKNEGSSGLLSTNEAKSLTAIATAEKGESSAEQPTLSNRNLLIFTAVDAWNSQLSQRRDNMAGSSVAGLIVGTVFIVIFASATITLIENVNKTEASEVELPDPEITLVSADWTWSGTEGTMVYTITNSGTETVNIAHVYLSKDGNDPFSCSTLTWDSSPAIYIFPGETIVATESGLDASEDDIDDNPQTVFLAVFEYSLAVSVT